MLPWFLTHTEAIRKAVAKDSSAWVVVVAVGMVEAMEVAVEICMALAMEALACLDVATQEEVADMAATEWEEAAEWEVAAEWEEAMAAWAAVVATEE